MRHCDLTKLIVSFSISSLTDKRSDDILEDNIQRNNKSSTSVTSPSTNGHNPSRRKSASGLIENGNSDGGLAPIAQDEDLDSNCNEDDEHGT